MEVSAANTKVGQLLSVVVLQGDVVYQYKHVPGSPLAHEVLLLVLEARHECAVPAVELEILESHAF